MLDLTVENVDAVSFENIGGVEIDPLTGIQRVRVDGDIERPTKPGSTFTMRCADTVAVPAAAIVNSTRPMKSRVFFLSINDTPC